MMRSMRKRSSAVLPRVIVYVYASPELPGDEDRALAADIEAICGQEGLTLVDRVVDRGPPKRRRSQYPVLARLLRGEADVLLVVRSPLYCRGALADRLEAAAAAGPFAWLSVAELQAAGLLPAAPATRRPQRAAGEAPARSRRSPRQTTPQTPTRIPTSPSPSPR